MTRSRSTTTASAEVRRIKRLLGAKKPLTPTQGGQLVMALKAAMNDPDAFATLDELTTLTVARFCSSAEQLDATAASALLATLPVPLTRADVKLLRLRQRLLLPRRRRQRASADPSTPRRR